MKADAADYRNYFMKRIICLSIAGIALVLPGIYLLTGCASRNASKNEKHTDPAGSAASVTAAKSVKRWRSPMDPNIIQDHPGKDSMGMDFIPIEESPEGMPAGTVRLDAARQQLIGMKTAVATRESFVRTLRASGRIAADETKLARIHVPLGGIADRVYFVDRVYADFIGKSVKRGEPLLTLHSAELRASQQDYLNAYRAQKILGKSALPEVRQGSEALLAASRQRLRLWNTSPGELRQLESSGQARGSATLASPVSGVITAKNVFPGMVVTPELELFQVADLATVWVMADFSESDFAALRAGQPAVITLDSQPGTRLPGKINFIQPVLNPVTRTITVRIALANPRRQLLPDMLAHVEIPVDEGERLVVPESAVVMSGTRSLVYVQKNPGDFAPMEVTTGVASGGRIEIKSGLQAGDIVVTEANFLLDSESRLKSAAPAPEQKP